MKELAVNEKVERSLEKDNVKQAVVLIFSFKLFGSLSKEGFNLPTSFKTAILL